jgi:hypothetical protein
MQASLNPANSDSWQKLSDDRIAHVVYETAIGYRLTEIFNFTNRECVRICRSIESGAASSHRVAFSEFDTFDGIHQAATMLEAAGGSAGTLQLRGPQKPALKPLPGK